MTNIPFIQRQHAFHSRNNNNIYNDIDYSTPNLNNLFQDEVNFDETIYRSIPQSTGPTGPTGPIGPTQQTIPDAYPVTQVTQQEVILSHVPPVLKRQNTSFELQIDNKSQKIN